MKRIVAIALLILGLSTGTAFAQTRRISLNPQEDFVPGWTLTLDVSETGYWFMVQDKTDPCGFAFVTTQAGAILTATPLR